MAKILNFEISEDEYNEFKEFLEKAVVEMRESREKMQSDQEEINRLDQEIEQLRAESEQIAAGNKKLLAELEAQILKAA